MRQQSSEHAISWATRIVLSILVVVLIGGALGVVGLRARQHVAAGHFEYYNYKGHVDVSAVDGSATWVPILTYHGIVQEPDNSDTNTMIDRFVDQMESLKGAGYETISVDDYYCFRAGEFELPARPVIITFDDGRKDTYYNGDDILKDLGFKATIFLITGSVPNKGGCFYLNWQELRKMRDSGRWELGSHGSQSHKPIGDGCFLVTKIAGESDQEYAARVEDDYRSSIDAFRKHLGVEPRFYAIPFGDYGVKESQSPCSGAWELNAALSSKYFELVLGSESASHMHNTAYANPYEIARVHVGNMSGEELLRTIG